MSAYGTEKFQTTSLRLGMPSAFAARYAKLGETPRFAPTAPAGEPHIMVGHDFQSQWHEQKMKDAMRMVRAKVESTRNMYNRANSAPNNCPGHQPAVLGQRVFANPSAGALQSGTPTRIEYASAPFHYSDAHGSMEGGSNGRLVGGVLRSAQGQAYGKTLLNKRINDFNAIDAEQMKFTLGGPGLEGMEGMPQPQPGQRATRFVGELPSGRDQLGLVPAVELAQLLQSVVDSLGQGLPDSTSVDRFTVADTVRAFSLIVRVASTGTADDITDILEFIEGNSSQTGIVQKLEDLTDEPITDVATRQKATAESLLEFWRRVVAYLRKMLPLATEDRPLRERAGASQAYIKSLKFKKMFSTGLPDEFLSAADAQESVDTRSGSQFSSAGPGAPRGDDDDDDRSAVTSLSSFSSPPGSRGPVRREDSQHGYLGPGSEFSYDDRQRFGYSSGEYSTGGRPVGYSGVAAVEYGDYATVPETIEEEDGDDIYLRDGESTIPINAGPRLTSSRSAVTGEYDVFADSRPQAPTRRVSQPAGRTRPVTDLTSFASLEEWLAQNAPEASVTSSAARSRPSTGRQSLATDSSAPVRRAARDRYNSRFVLQGEAAPVSSRSDLPNTIPALRALAERVNAYYKNNLPDGSGPIRLRADSKVRNVKLNFIRRLGL